METNGVIAFFAILVPLVLFHEFGHFIVCKLGGIRVTKFAFGFGRKLFGFTYRDTEYRWNLIPLGGYVDFMGDVLYTESIPDDVKHFYNRPKWLRFLVLVMGPLFNLIMALAIYWAFFATQPVSIPKNDGEPYTVGFVMPGSPEAEAGLTFGDRITAIDGDPIIEYKQVEEFFLLNPGKEITLEVLRAGQPIQIELTIPRDKVHGTGNFNFEPKRVVMVDEIEADMPAKQAGLQVGDQILKVNGQPFSLYKQEYFITGLLEKAAPGPSQFLIARDGQEQTLEIQPVRHELEDEAQRELYEKDAIWITGFRPAYDRDVIHFTFGQALGEAWHRFLDDSQLLIRAVRQLVQGDLSVRTLSGPLEIGKVAKRSMDMGVWSFLFMMAILSINLGILNLLPIPVLDGGEIFVLMVEWITRRDFSIPTKLRIKLVGLFFLFGLMGLVIVTDVIKAFQTMG